jgi:steroid delta-isomerase-like uncharacterized protein
MEASTSAAHAAEVASRDFEALSRRDAAGMAAVYTDDCVVDFVPVGVVRGSDELRKFFEGLFGAVPDLETTYEVAAADDTTAVVEWRMRGTFTGSAFQGVEATGRDVRLRGVDVMKIEGDHIAQNTAYYDGMSFAREIGLMPAQDSAAEKAMIGAFNAMTKLRGRFSQR